MSKSTTGRQLLDDLERRVAALEGESKPDPMNEVRQKLDDIDRRLKGIEAERPKTPVNNQSAVANG